MKSRHCVELKGKKLFNFKFYSEHFKKHKPLIVSITPEELWACTTCNACTLECPVNIEHVSIILELRRFHVMERAAAPSQLNNMFSNIENNGAPWQFSQQDRMLWAE
jgi:Fe-S oxidoreductase